MPWPYISTRNKGRPSSTVWHALPSDDVALDGAPHATLDLSLDEAEHQDGGGRWTANDGARRAISLDVSRPSLDALIAPLTLSSASTAGKHANSKARRSSFPRLPLPSWRQSSPSPSTPSTPSSLRAGSSSSFRAGGTSSPSKSASIRSSKRHSRAPEEEEDGGVELQEGYGTPYTATGLKGGFQCISPQPSTRSDGSASIASTSSSSRRSAGGSSNLFSLLPSSSSASRKSDEYSLDTQPSSIHSYSSSPNKDKEDTMGAENQATVKRQTNDTSPSRLPVADSEFADFGPHTIVEEEERKKALPTKYGQLDRGGDQLPSSRYHGSEDDDDDGGQTCRDGSSNVTIPRKARSRGWFSFNSKNEGPTSSSTIAALNNADEAAFSAPKHERSAFNIPSGTVSIAESSSTSSTIEARTANAATTISANGSTTPNSTSKKIKQSTPSKGMSMFRNAGRKRGDSEVSMKDMSASSDLT